MRNSLAGAALAALATMAGAEGWGAGLNPGFVYAVRLVDTSGNPEPAGSVPCRAAVYDAAAGGTPCWSSDVTGAVTGTNGAFSVTLGTDDAKLRNALCVLTQKGKDAYLQMTVKGVTLPVRQKLGRAAFATVAGSAAKVSGDFLAQKDATFNQTLSVSGGADFGTTTVNGKLAVGKSLVLSNGTVVAQSDMHVGGSLSAGSALLVKGQSLKDGGKPMTNAVPSATVAKTFATTRLTVTKEAKQGGNKGGAGQDDSGGFDGHFHVG